MKKNKLIKHISSFSNTILSLFAFGNGKKEENHLTEEAIQSPSKMIVRNFISNKIALTGLIALITIFSVVFISSAVIPLDIYYSEPILQNIAPGYGYLDLPKELKNEGVEMISSGASYSVGLSKKGNVYVWGKDVEGVTNLPKELKGSKIVKVASGDRHIIALTNSGDIIGWGRDNFKQAQVPMELTGLLKMERVTDIQAGDMVSAALTQEGNVYVWGATMSSGLDIIPTVYQGRIKQIELSATNMLLLLDDHTVGVVGIQGNELSTVPTELTDGSVKVVDIASTLRNGLALDDKGNLYSWGNLSFGLSKVPDTIDSKVVSIDSGRSNFVVVDENKNVHTWGANHYGQLNVPSKLTNVENVYADYFQNYAVDTDGKVEAWGNNGFLLGTDEVGRDMFTRLMHGGRESIKFGLIVTFITVILGTIFGLLAGFFKRLDNIIMRAAEIIGSIPVLPIIITLSATVASSWPENVKMSFVMALYGLLGWTGLARMIRGQILSEREKDYVTAARALGVKNSVIIIKHMLPSVVNIIIVNLTLGFAGGLLLESGLSFLGFGVKPPAPSWGNMLDKAKTSTVMELYWWRWIIPSVSILLTALSVNLVGDGLRDAMDPKSNEK